MNKDVFWSEDKVMVRSVDNMINHNGRSCKNCFYGQGYDNDFTTCGLHHVNFRINSLCDNWVSLDDPEHKEYLERKKQQVLNKIK